MLVALAFAAFWGIYLLVFAPRTRRSVAHSEGQLADFDWDLQDLNGKPLSLARYRGKTVFLNEWATWCPPCVAELPSISQLAENPQLKDVVFLCVSLDSNLDVVRGFVNQQPTPLPMTIVWSNGPVPAVFETEAIPSTFIIAPDGRIARHDVGSKDWNDPEVVSLLERLAKRPRAPL
jgi:thiol-disulfide isomerase/thioredoxin